MNVDRELKRHFIGRTIENGRRIDGRGFDDMRDISVELNMIDDKAEGSARVQLGGSDVLCGVKLGVGTPYPDNPDSGVMMTGLELVPIASPDFETGRPSDVAIELARVVDRGIRESGMIDLDKLCIEPNEAVWMVSIDIHVLNHDGNLMDASTIAAVNALKNTWVPKYEDGQVVREKSMDLPITRIPLTTTFAKIGKEIILDPVLDEEYAMDARMTVSTSGKAIHAMQKGENGSFSPNEVSTMVDKSMSMYKTLKKSVK